MKSIVAIKRRQLLKNKKNKRIKLIKKINACVCCSEEGEEVYILFRNLGKLKFGLETKLHIIQKSPCIAIKIVIEAAARNPKITSAAILDSFCFSNNGESVNLTPKLRELYIEVQIEKVGEYIEYAAKEEFTLAWFILDPSLSTLPLKILVARWFKRAVNLNY